MSECPKNKSVTATVVHTIPDSQPIYTMRFDGTITFKGYFLPSFDAFIHWLDGLIPDGETTENAKHIPPRPEPSKTGKV